MFCSIRKFRSIQGTDYVYLAMKAMLRAIKDHNLRVKNGRASDNDTYIKSAACTGLGTFYGVCGYELQSLPPGGLPKSPPFYSL